jgi:hypothetical protein
MSGGTLSLKLPVCAHHLAVPVRECERRSEQNRAKSLHEKRGFVAETPHFSLLA